jgi:hypothetical protein
MSNAKRSPSRPTNEPRLGRRELLGYTGAFGAAFLAAQGLVEPAAAQQQEQAPQGRAQRRRRHARASRMSECAGKTSQRPSFSL